MCRVSYQHWVFVSIRWIIFSPRKSAPLHYSSVVWKLELCSLTLRRETLAPLQEFSHTIRFLLHAGNWTQGAMHAPALSSEPQLSQHTFASGWHLRLCAQSALLNVSAYVCGISLPGQNGKQPNSLWCSHLACDIEKHPEGSWIKSFCCLDTMFKKFSATWWKFINQVDQKECFR